MAPYLKSNGKGYRPPNKYQMKKMPMATKKVDIVQNEQIVNIKKKIKQIENDTEVKWKDTQHDLLAMSPVSTLSLLNGIQQGVAASVLNRLGDKLQATSIQFRGSILTDADAVAPIVYRIIILWDRQPNGTAPIFSDVLDTTTVTSALSNTVYAPYNLKNAPRFKILKDICGVINPQLSTSAILLVPATSHYIHFKVPLKRIVNYGLGNVGTIADISSNALFGLYLSDRNAGADPPVLTAGIRFLFKDA